MWLSANDIADGNDTTSLELVHRTINANLAEQGLPVQDRESLLVGRELGKESEFDVNCANLIYHSLG